MLLLLLLKPHLQELAYERVSEAMCGLFLLPCAPCLPPPPPQPLLQQHIPVFLEVMDAHPACAALAEQTLAFLSHQAHDLVHKVRAGSLFYVSLLAPIVVPPYCCCNA